MSEARVNITGRVQGVGFRPFIYNLAVKHGLKGYVKNIGDAGVEVVIEGKRKSIEKFLDEVASDSPQVSEIDEISVKYRPYRAGARAGDIENFESYEYERDTIRNLKRVLNITRNPDVIGCDLHPGYMTSHLAGEMSQETGSPLVKSQHHHAHIASVCAENNVEPDQPVVGIALDGVGYGTDGAVWGGEVLISTYSDFERYGHLEYLPIPGGNLCTKYPMRMLVSALTTVISDEEIRDITRNHMQNGFKHGEIELEIVLNNARKPRVIKTSLSGRFLDSISVLTGLCYERTYEGEPIIKLEAAVKRGNPYKIKHDPEITMINDRYVLKTGKTLELLTNLSNKVNRYDIMAFGQKYPAHGITQMACAVASDQGVNIVAISGGVLANEYISNHIQRYLENANLTAIY